MGWSDYFGKGKINNNVVGGGRFSRMLEEKNKIKERRIVKINEPVGLTGKLIITNLANSYIGTILKTVVLTIIPAKYTTTVRIIQLVSPRWVSGAAKTAYLLVSGVVGRIAGVFCYDNLSNGEVTGTVAQKLIEQAKNGSDEGFIKALEPLKEAIQADVAAVIQEEAAELAALKAYSLSEAAGTAVDLGITAIAGGAASYAVAKMSDPNAAWHWKGANLLGDDLVNWVNGENNAALYIISLSSAIIISLVLYKWVNNNNNKQALIEAKHKQLEYLQIYQEYKEEQMKLASLKKEVTVLDTIKDTIDETSNV